MIVAADTPTPAVLGIQVLGTRPRFFLPGAYIQFLRVAGLEMGDPIDDELLIEGALRGELRRVDDKIIAHNRTAVDFTSGPVEKRTSTQRYGAGIPAAERALRRNGNPPPNFRAGATHVRVTVRARG